MVDALEYKLVKDGVEPFTGEPHSRTRGSRPSMAAVQAKEQIKKSSAERAARRASEVGSWCRSDGFAKATEAARKGGPVFSPKIVSLTLITSGCGARPTCARPPSPPQPAGCDERIRSSPTHERVRGSRVARDAVGQARASVCAGVRARGGRAPQRRSTASVSACRRCRRGS